MPDKNEPGKSVLIPASNTNRTASGYTEVLFTLVSDRFDLRFFIITIITALALLLPGGFLVSSLPSAALASTPDLDRPPRDDEVSYRPADGDSTYVNPPAFTWLPAEGVDRYIVQYSRSASFAPGQTETVREVDMTVHIPDRTLEPGTWYWRYGHEDGEQERFSRTRRFRIPASATDFPYIDIDEALTAIPEQRPRVYFTPEMVEEIRADTAGRFAHLTRPVIEQAEEILAMEEPLFEEPKPWEDYGEPLSERDGTRWWPIYVETRGAFRSYNRRMVPVAKAWLYTGEERFAEEARRRLMHVAGWDVEGSSSALWPTSLGMDLAEMMPRTFDWIYDYLSEEERRLCKEAIGARMEQINRRVHRARPMEARPFGSHPGRMVGFVVEGGIVLAHEDARARDWLDYTSRLMWSTYPAWGGAPGGWHEGPGYWAGYMRRMIPIINELDRLGIPIKDKPFFRNTGWFGLYAAYPGRPTRAFGDGYSNPLGSGPGVVTYMLSTLYQNPYFRWHAEQIGAGLPSGPSAIDFYDPRVPSRVPDDLPQSRVFYDVGLAALHNDMADPENNIMMFFQSNPYGGISHNHANQNAFVIEAYGEPLAISTGARHVHGMPHHREWMWHTHAHNSILVDGEGQIARTRVAGGEIIHYEENDDYVMVTGDATAAYGDRLERFHRHVLYLRPDRFVIIDDLQTGGSPSTFQWLLHSPTEMRVDSGGRVVISRSGNARLTTRYLTPGAIDFSQHTGFEPQVERPNRFQNQFHLTVSTRNAAPEKRFVTVMKVDRTTGPPVVKPDPPTTPRRELELRGITGGDRQARDAVLEQTALVEAEGGIAVRVDHDLILWKAPEARRVQAAGVSSDKAVEVRRGFFDGQAN